MVAHHGNAMGINERTLQAKFATWLGAICSARFSERCQTASAVADTAFTVSSPTRRSKYESRQQRQ